MKRARPRLPAAVAVAGATVAFAVGIGVGVSVNVWVATGAAALLSGALVIAAAVPGFWRRAVPGWTPLVAGAGAGVVLAVATHGAYRLAVLAIPVLDQHVTGLYGQLDDWPGLPAAAVILALAVVVEELVWRGLLVDLLESRDVSRLMLVIIASVLYALPQVATGSVLVILIGFGCGLLWTGERMMTGSLAAPLATHLVWDLLVFVVWPVT